MPELRKPRLRPHSIELLNRVDSCIRTYDVRGQALVQAASDELDGAVTRDEIDELVRKGLLTVVRDGRSEFPGAPYAQICGGDGYTVHLTEDAVAHFWSDRAGVAHG